VAIDPAAADASAIRTPGLLPNAKLVVDHFYADVRVMSMLGGLRLVTAATTSVRSA
jgi:hypothetical protein